jgi:DNA-binding NtrC family response regulator
MTEPHAKPPSDIPPAGFRLRPELHGRGEHLLHVDDEPTVTLSVRRILQKLGYSIDSFNCPNAALVHFCTAPHRYRLVLTDLMMPGMNGLQFATAVTALRPGLPVVLFSAFADGCIAEEVRRSGIRETLSKPAGLIPIAEVVRRALDSHSP